MRYRASEKLEIIGVNGGAKRDHRWSAPLDPDR